jgi:uroporphyrinogen-III synthase
MTTERLTAREYFVRQYPVYTIKGEHVPNEITLFKEELFKMMQAFAAQEVEAVIAETKKQRDELLEALKKIVNPIAYMRSKLKDGEQLNGHYAIQLSGDPQYLKGIALTAITNAQEK